MMRQSLTIWMLPLTFSHYSITTESQATSLTSKKDVFVQWCATCPSEKD
jgi:hypothetical protein